MNKRTIGTYYEDAACAFLENKGIRIIERNVHCGRIGEIDIIGIDQGIGYGDTLVFFEVKYRNDASYGAPYEAVNAKKIRTIRRCAEWYLAYRENSMLIRFDVISICGEEINWFKDAF